MATAPAPTITRTFVNIRIVSSFLIVRLVGAVSVQAKADVARPSAVETFRRGCIRMQQ
jgi:hypothetical protein